MSAAIPYYDTTAESYAPAYDPEAVSAKLAELGWADSDGDGILEKDGVKLEFTALCTPDDFVVRAAQVVQAHFSDVGVGMQVQQIEFATLLEQVQASEHQAAFIAYSYPDPDIAYILFHSSQAAGGVNFPQVQDPHLDELIETGRTEMDTTVRGTIYAEAQRYISDQAFILPLWVRSNYIAFADSLKGAVLHPDTYTVYYDAYLED
jgi:peptide/nickel transport system substrate-binding protein